MRKLIGIGLTIVIIAVLLISMRGEHGATAQEENVLARRNAIGFLSEMPLSALEQDRDEQIAAVVSMGHVDQCYVRAFSGLHDLFYGSRLSDRSLG